MTRGTSDKMHAPELHIARKHWTVPDSFRYCEQKANRHYENFPVASLLLPKDKRPYVHAMYSFARTADDFADEPGWTPAERIENLNAWEQNLLDCVDGHATHPVFIALAETIERFQIPVELFQSLLIAFRSDVTVRRYETFEDVLAYCENSANPVGRLVLLLFNYRSEALHAYSDSICTALQLTNFWQDIAVDLSKDRVYLPREDLDRFGYSEQDLFDRRFGKRFQDLLAFEVGRTEQLFKEGTPLLAAVNRDLSMELRLTWHGGMKILDKIRKQNFDVFRRRPTLSAFDKLGVLLHARRR